MAMWHLFTHMPLPTSISAAGTLSNATLAWRDTFPDGLMQLPRTSSIAAGALNADVAVQPTVNDDSSNSTLIDPRPPSPPSLLNSWPGRDDRILYAAAAQGRACSMDT